MTKDKWGRMTWHERGAYLGYPRCCVTAFANSPEDRTHIQRELMAGLTGWSGFIPCGDCCASLLESGQPVSSLIVNRQHPQPFPEFSFSQ